MELNSIRTNKHISVASSGHNGDCDIMNTRCQTPMIDVAWEQNTGSHKLCPIGHITMDSPDTAPWAPRWRCRHPMVSSGEDLGILCAYVIRPHLVYYTEDVQPKTCLSNKN